MENKFEDFLIEIYKWKNLKQAGTELCQAQNDLD